MRAHASRALRDELGLVENTIRTIRVYVSTYVIIKEEEEKKEEPLLLILKKYLDDIWNNASSQTRIYPLQVKQFKIEHMKRKIYICLCCCCYCCCFCCYCKFLEYMAGLMTICSVCNYTWYKIAFANLRTCKMAMPFWVIWAQSSIDKNNRPYLFVSKFASTLKEKSRNTIFINFVFFHILFLFCFTSTTKQEPKHTYNNDERQMSDEVV